MTDWTDDHQVLTNDAISGRSNVIQFPRKAVRFTPLVDLPPGTSFRCEAPDWRVMKTEDFGKTWACVGDLRPPSKGTPA